MSKQTKKSKQSCEKLSSIRLGRRRYLDEIVDNARAVLSDTSVHSEQKFKQFRLRIKEELESIRRLDEEIINLLEDDLEILTDLKHAGEFRDKVTEVLLQIEEYLSKPVDLQKITPRETAAASKLPKLKLKRFNGEVTQWQTFWDTYKSAIHSDMSMNIITKFSYLRDLLEGSAAAAIAGLTTTEANYESAIDLLQKRFGDSQVIINGHHDALLKIAPLHSSKDIKELRNLHDKVEVHVRGLQSLNVLTSAYGSLLIPVLLGKIPEDIRLLIGRQMKDGHWELSRLLDLLRDEIENRERCSGIQASFPTNNSNTPVTKQMPSTASALLTDGRKPNCTYCRQIHASHLCKIVTDKAARKDILRQQGRCFICLRKNHVARNCESKGKCFSCAGKHHVSICDGRSLPLKPDEMPKVINQSSKTNALYVSGKDSILLQTAQIYIHGVDAKEKIRARLLFDSGSQLSFICQDIASHLKLPIVGKEILDVKVFGRNYSQVRDYDIVQFTVESIREDFAVTMEAHSTPNICTPICQQNINGAIEQFDYLQGIPLADCSSGEDNLEINLLIGAKDMAKFFDGLAIRGEKGDGPTAHSTKLGWVLSGCVTSAVATETSQNVNYVSSHVLQVQIGSENQHTDDIVQSLWDYESIGIRKLNTVHESFIQNIEVEDNRYCVTLPCKENHELLPDNYELSLSRLQSLLKRLRSDPEMYKEYDDIIRDQEKKGIIERVESLSETGKVGKIHYLPHQPVKRQDALTTKLRVVFDASSKGNLSLPSLNECVYVGPSMVPAIVDILLRFRSFKVA